MIWQVWLMTLHLYEPKVILAQMATSKSKFVPTGTCSLSYKLLNQSKISTNMVHDLSNSSFLAHMSFLCVLIANWGVAFKKIIKRSSDTVRDFLNAMALKYTIDIAKRAPGARVGRTVVTLGRIKSLFPFLMCQIYMNGNAKIVITQAMITEVVLTTVPKCLLQNSLISLFPFSFCTKAKKGGLRSWTFAVSVVLDYIYHKQGRRIHYHRCMTIIRPYIHQTTFLKM